VYRPDVEAGYGEVRRTWKDGDTIEIDFPMPVRLVHADEQVDADRGRVAIERGPVVYAAEEADLGADPDALSISTDAPLRAEWRADLLGGVQTVHGNARLGDTITEFTAVPYATWSNRGGGAMRVWFRRAQDTGF
jgi:DUF1680 family protein